MKRKRIIGWAVALLAAALTSCSENGGGPTTPGGGTLELNSGVVPPGGVYKHVFANAGTFPYHCTIHLAMTGNSVTVSAGSANDSAFVQIVSSTAPGFSPSAVTIKPGGYVRWINAHSTSHTVTSGSGSGSPPDYSISARVIFSFFRFSPRATSSV